MLHSALVFVRNIEGEFQYLLTLALYYHVVVCKCFILANCFRIGPLYCLSWQVQQGCNIVLWGNSNQYSYIH